MAATIELLEQGQVDASMQQIAEHAGLAKSVVYRQFSGRDELDRRVRTAICLQFTDTLDTALNVSFGSIREILTRAVSAVVEWFETHPRLHDFLRKGPAVGDPDDVDAVTSLATTISARTRGLVSGLAGVVGVVDEPAVDTMCFAIVSMTEATVTRWARDPDPAMDRATLVTTVTGYAWSVLDAVARDHALTLDPDRPLLEVLSELADDTP
ncbi:TetR/AcrR family transcriptional regulator [Nocardia uniformis]|uniref:TetR/AcrR family transcriptional regulator n=1 Tax=Nocardia uniformis TaxID=53432 RepID=A0A849BV59_9NOCA|nr:TetR/AcrR family transcriptional regulator [Nocardia uniformis]